MGIAMPMGTSNKGILDTWVRGTWESSSLTGNKTICLYWCLGIRICGITAYVCEGLKHAVISFAAGPLIKSRKKCKLPSLSFIIWTKVCMQTRQIPHTFPRTLSASKTGLLVRTNHPNIPIIGTCSSWCTISAHRDGACFGGQLLRGCVSGTREHNDPRARRVGRHQGRCECFLGASARAPPRAPNLHALPHDLAGQGESLLCHTHDHHTPQ